MEATESVILEFSNEEYEKKRYDENQSIIIPILKEINNKQLQRYSYRESYHFELTLNVALYYFPKVQNSPYCREILFYLASVIALCRYGNVPMERVLSTFMVDFSQNALKTDLIGIFQEEILRYSMRPEPSVSIHLWGRNPVCGIQKEPYSLQPLSRRP